MRVAVIGGGSWGTAFARLLALSGHQTTLVCRDPVQADAIARHHRNPRYLFSLSNSFKLCPERPEMRCS